MRMQTQRQNEHLRRGLLDHTKADCTCITFAALIRMVIFWLLILSVMVLQKMISPWYIICVCWCDLVKYLF